MASSCKPTTTCSTSCTEGGALGQSAATATLPRKNASLALRSMRYSRYNSVPPANSCSKFMMLRQPVVTAYMPASPPLLPLLLPPLLVLLQLLLGNASLLLTPTLPLALMLPLMLLLELLCSAHAARLSKVDSSLVRAAAA